MRVKSFKAKPITVIGIFSLVVGAVLSYLSSTISKSGSQQQSYLLQAKNISVLKKALNRLHVKPSHELAIINSFAVDLTSEQLKVLKQYGDFKVTKNSDVKLSGSVASAYSEQISVVNKIVNATSAHQVNNYGAGVTMAFLDTGLRQLTGIRADVYGLQKTYGTYDAINDKTLNNDNEINGHGTHVSSIAGNSELDIYGKPMGVAPNARMVGIKAFDFEGKGTYADIIRGIDWAVKYKDTLNIRVLNMSFSGPPRSYYWDDPLNQAVMKAWQSGIVVVASAGNKGPDPMSIGVPGNNPYIITVGAMTDHYTPDNTNDDRLTSFSSAGPTVEGFVKPDLVAPGGHMVGLLPSNTRLAKDHPEAHDGGKYFTMSGTSQATGVVTGIVALMLSQDPSLSPDDVKCRLLSTAKAAFSDEDTFAYSIFQQGSGLVDAQGAISSTQRECANQSLDVALDLAGTEHYGGPANRNKDGEFYIISPDGSVLNDGGTIWRDGGTIWRDGGTIWRDGGTIWRDGGTIWRDGGTVWRDGGYSWNDGGTIWRDGYPQNDGGTIWRDGGFIWRDTIENDSKVNHWVDQE
ncbi:S8 family peptidase [Pseudoalteromonas denitrificans]|uniref:Serine protease AprX n=1 Tax=Pseudoalteromonas denitrificans DSM 6059 TaxID=1123010 RepID=A0A1I1RC69_9GAMM|nr:S8 family peptidase [Pseudoalteromonas denitrificans]SFD31976.1 serine protease AprX [Pseudoalteromonas denitrificans DSM 6059]